VTDSIHLSFTLGPVQAFVAQARRTRDLWAGSWLLSYLAESALAMFLAMLATTAGNLALSVGAHGGVYLAGGILPAMRERLERSAFRTRFEAKGRYRDYLAAIPVYLITHPTPALSGLVEIIRRGRGQHASPRPDPG